jgi:aminomuconate-semialdehyde/2-hydroxymuconate-6-semialdehyde dehydrogenase
MAVGWSACSRMETLTNYIDGKCVQPGSANYLENYEPATGKVYSLIPDSDEDDVNAAVSAAVAAAPAWSRMPAAERAAYLLKIADILESRLDEFSRAESRDNGKPLWLAEKVEIPRAVTNFRFFAAAIQSYSSESHEMAGQAINYTVRQPHGVVGLISPWNLPLYLFTWKVAPALACGNTAVAKPSEVTPYTAHLFAEVAIEAGLPAGVLNIVHGTGAKVGAPLVEHADVPAISFTGGTSTGRGIAAVAGRMLKKTSLELGGKNPTIVFDDCDLSEVVPAAVRAAFANQGQICLCGSRVFVQSTIYEEFLERFTEQAKALVVGDPLEAGTGQGALVSASHLEKVKQYVALAREEGGVINCGGQAPEQISDRCKNGYYFQPTVITGLDPYCRVNQEEIFGPVVTVFPFDDDAQVVEYANCTSYGLSASVWTNDLRRAHRMANAIKSGTVWVNCWMVRDLRVPFGGMKTSGLGREGGDETLRFFTETKNICIQY